MPPKQCDRCGRTIGERDLRYVAQIQVFAAPDLVISEEDLTQDTQAELDRWLAACEGKTEEELMRDVYVELQFDLCQACQQAFLLNPLKS